MTTRIQKRKALGQLVSGEFEMPDVEDSTVENPVAGENFSPETRLGRHLGEKSCLTLQRH